MVFPGEGFDPLATLQTIAEERCTSLYGVPTMFIAELDHPEFAPLRSLLAAHRHDGRRALPDRGDAPRHRTRCTSREITIGYGMTETSPVSFQTPIDDPLEQRVSTVGRVHPHVEVKIVDAEGRIVPRGTPGELCTRGYLGHARLLGRCRAHRPGDRRRAGWMHTGDLATIDAEGYCNIVGRIKDMVIRGGENVYPREVEEFLYRHPKIQDVQVFGVPDPRYGEELCAWVRLRDGERLRRRGDRARSARARSRISRSRAMSASSTTSR